MASGDVTPPELAPAVAASLVELSVRNEREMPRILLRAGPVCR